MVGLEREEKQHGHLELGHLKLQEGMVEDGRGLELGHLKLQQIQTGGHEHDLDAW